VRKVVFRVEGRYVLRGDLARPQRRLISVDRARAMPLPWPLRLDCPIYVEETVLKSSSWHLPFPNKVTTKSLRLGWKPETKTWAVINVSRARRATSV